MIIGREVKLKKVRKFFEEIRAKSSMPENGSVAEFLESFSDFVEDFNIFADPDMKETGITISRNQSFSVRLNAVEIFQTHCAYEALWSAMMNLIALKVYPELSSGTISKRIMSKLKL